MAATADRSGISDKDDQEIKVVSWSVGGQPIGPGSEAFSSKLGDLTRTHCPIYYTSWPQVTPHAKATLMTKLEEEYTIPTEVKTQILKKANGYWSNYKKYLRTRYLDPYPTDRVRLTHCPPKIRMEDWERFVANESTEDAKSRRVKGKALRACMRNPHTSGRKGLARMSDALKRKDPNRNISRTDLYLAAHTKKDGSYPTEELGSKIEKIQAIISNNPSSTSLDVDHDPVAQTFGKDHGGRILGMEPGVSRSSLVASGPARKRLRDEELIRLSLQEQFDNFKADVAKKFAEISSQIVAQSSHASAPTSCGTPQSNQRSSLPSQLSTTSQKCDILHPGGRVVGVGSVMRGGDPPPDGFLWVVVDLATDENAFLMSPHQSNNVLGDIVGCSTLWPTGFVRRL